MKLTILGTDLKCYPNEGVYHGTISIFRVSLVFYKPLEAAARGYACSWMVTLIGAAEPIRADTADSIEEAAEALATSVQESVKVLTELKDLATLWSIQGIPKK